MLRETFCHYVICLNVFDPARTNKRLSKQGFVPFLYNFDINEINNFQKKTSISGSAAPLSADGNTAQNMTKTPLLWVIGGTQGTTSMKNKKTISSYPADNLSFSVLIRTDPYSDE